MTKEIEITKDLQKAFCECDAEHCGSQCIASMSNGDCLFDYIDDLDSSEFCEE